MLDIGEQRRLSIIIDELDMIHPFQEFIKCIHDIITHLQQRNFDVKILLTSRPTDATMPLFKEFLSIEYDKERRGSLVDYVTNS